MLDGTKVSIPQHHRTYTATAKFGHSAFVSASEGKVVMHSMLEKEMRLGIWYVISRRGEEECFAT